MRAGPFLATSGTTGRWSLLDVFSKKNLKAIVFSAGTRCPQNVSVQVPVHLSLGSAVQWHPKASCMRT